MGVSGCVGDCVRVCVRVLDTLGEEDDDGEPDSVVVCVPVELAEDVCDWDEVPVDVPVNDRVAVAVGVCDCVGVIV